MKRISVLTSAASIVGAMFVLAGCAEKTQPVEESRYSNETVLESFGGSNAYALKGSGLDFGGQDAVVRDSVSLIVPRLLNGRECRDFVDTILYTALYEKGRVPSDAISAWLKANMKLTEDETGYKTERLTTVPDSYAGFENVTGSIVNLDEDFLSYRVAVSLYLPGAANGTETWKYLNYSFAEGRVLSLSDLFTPAGVAEMLVLLNNRARQNPLYAGQVTINSLPAANNYFISPDGKIVVSYAPMEVGPHSLGNVQVGFYPMELEDGLTRLGRTLFGIN